MDESMKATEKFAIVFGQEELLYLLRSLGLPDLPGMGEKPWGEITRETSVFVLDAVGRSLFARGIVSFDGQGEIVVEKTVRAILTASAYARQIVLLTYAGPNGQSHQINYYRVREFDVCQSTVMPWLYQFELQTRTDLGQQFVEQWTLMIKTELSTTVMQLQQATLDQARETASADPILATEMLVQAGIEKNIAQKFVNPLAAPVVTLRFQSADATDNSVKRNSFSILAGQDSCWLLTADTAEGLVSLKAVSTPELKRIITTAYLPFQHQTVSKNE